MAKPQQREIHKAPITADDSLFDDAPPSEAPPVGRTVPIDLGPVSSGGEALVEMLRETTQSPAVDLPRAETPAFDVVLPQAPSPDGFESFPPEPMSGRYGAPPYDHAPVQLTADGAGWAVAQWQISRRWGGNKRWEPYGFWALRSSGGKPVPFTPIGWRRFVG